MGAGKAAAEDVAAGAGAAAGAAGAPADVEQRYSWMLASGWQASEFQSSLKLL